MPGSVTLRKRFWFSNVDIQAPAKHEGQRPELGAEKVS